MTLKVPTRETSGHLSLTRQVAVEGQWSEERIKSFRAERLEAFQQAMVKAGLLPVGEGKELTDRLHDEILGLEGAISSTRIVKAEDGKNIEEEKQAALVL